MAVLYQVLKYKTDTFAGLEKRADLSQKTEYGRDFSATANER